MLNHVSWNLTRKIQRYRDADAIVLSLGKSGRTWLRVMLHKYLSLRFEVPFEPLELRSETRAFPSIAYSHELAAHYRDDRFTQRIAGKSILPRSLTDRKNLVILSRDPRDVVVSSYFHKTQRSRKTDCTLEEFIHHPRWGIEGLVWIMNTWRRRFEHHTHCSWVCYEDLRTDTASELERTIEALGISVDRTLLDDAIAFAAFDRMKSAEARGVYSNPRLRPGDPDQPDSFKVRRGKVGGYRDDLDAHSLAFLDREVQKLDAFYGYR